MLAILVLVSLLALAQAPSTASQPTPGEAPPAPRDAALWLEEAKTQTEVILKDHPSFEYANYDFLLRARLAESWWKADPQRAKRYLESSELITREGKSESPLEGLRRLAMSITVMEVVSRLDHTASDQMLDAILTQAAKIGPTAKSLEELQSKINLTFQLQQLSLSETANLEQQKKVYRALLGMDSGEATTMLYDFYYKDNTLGDQLYGEALDAVANHTLSLEQMQMLANLSFPLNPLPERIKVSPQNTERLLKTARDGILQAMDKGLTKESCGNVVMPILLPHYPPEVQAEIKPAIDQCKALLANPALNRDLDDATTQKLETPDDYLQAAENAKTVEQKARYKEQALVRLYQKDPEKAMSLLQGMSKEERDSYPQFESQRQNLETSLIRVRFKAHDFNGLQRLIDDSPFPAKTALMIANTVSREDPAYAQSLLPIVVNGLADGKADDSFFYPMALKYIARTSMPMMPVAMRDAIKGLNQMSEFIPGLTKRPKDRKVIHASFWWKMEPLTMPPLFEVLEPRTTQLMIAELRYPLARASFQLWLLNAELKEYGTAMQPKAKPEAPAGKAAPARTGN